MDLKTCMYKLLLGTIENGIWYVFIIDFYLVSGFTIFDYDIL